MANKNEKYALLDFRYVKEVDKNVEWLKDHGFREVVLNGVVDHYEYDILYQFKSKWKVIALVCVYRRPSGWRSKLAPLITPYTNGGSVVMSLTCNDVRDCLLILENDLARIVSDVDDNMGPDYDGPLVRDE